MGLRSSVSQQLQWVSGASFPNNRHKYQVLRFSTTTMRFSSFVSQDLEAATDTMAFLAFVPQDLDAVSKSSLRMEFRRNALVSWLRKLVGNSHSVEYYQLAYISLADRNGYMIENTSSCALSCSAEVLCTSQSHHSRIQPSYDYSPSRHLLREIQLEYALFMISNLIGNSHGT